MATLSGQSVPLDDLPTLSGQSVPTEDLGVSTYPLAGEIAQTGKDIVKAIPRAAVQGAGNLISGTGESPNTFNLNYPDEPQQVQNQLDENHPVARAAAKEIADRLGLPKINTKNPYVNIASGAVEGGVSGAAMGPLGVVPGAISGGLSSTAEQMGAGPVGQLVAGMLPIGPSAVAAGARGLYQHGTPEEIQQGLESFERARVSPTGNQVGLGTNRGAATQRTIAGQADEVKASLKSSFPPTGQLEGGEAFENGVRRSRLQQAQEESTAFGVSRAMIGGETPMPATNTTKVAQGITHKFDDDKLNDFLASTKSQQVESVLKSTDKPSVQGSILVPGPRGGYAPAEIPQQGMTFDKLRALRSRIGEMIDWGLVPGGNAEANGQLKQLYNALGQDIEAGISKSSPEARFAYQKAINMYKQNAAQRELLDTKMKDIGGPEASFKAATNSAALVDGPSQMKSIWSTMNPDEQASFRNALTTKMQYPKGAEGRGFDENTYRTNWQNMHDDVRTMIYGPRGSDMREKMEGIGNVLNIREQMGQNNPSAFEKSQTRATTKGFGAMIKGALGSLGVGAGAIAVEHAPGLLHQAIEHPVGVGTTLATAAAGYGAKTAMGRILNNKTALNFLAQTNKIPRSALPTFLAQLDRMGQTGQDIKDTIQGNE